MAVAGSTFEGPSVVLLTGLTGPRPSSGGCRRRRTEGTNAEHRGLLTNEVVGALIGVMAGPVGWAADGGGVLGGLSARLRSVLFKAELLGIGEELPPGYSVFIAAVEHTWVERPRKEL